MKVVKIFTDKSELSTEPAKISLLLYRISQGINKLIREKAKEHKVSSTQIQTVIFLSGAHPRNKNVTSITSRLQVAQPTASRVVGSLVDKGLVQRERSEKDRRKVKLELTEKGESIAESINEISQVLQDSVQSLTEERQSKFSQDLVEIAGGLQSQGHLSTALTCQYCRFFDRDGGDSEDRPHHCKLTGEDMSEEESCSEWVHQETGLNLIESRTSP
ncbi:MarR family transcriptional regulator [Candidatus Bipolaricaulota bacterium]|nr:MarR family transcriptional regulator [Candidatus Bipolaricaulota bacterium]